MTSNNERRAVAESRLMSGELWRKFCDDLKAAGFWAGGASQHAVGSCWDAPFEGRVALVMGSEGDGISRLVLYRRERAVMLERNRGVRMMFIHA